jgi:outer membrane receptor protein involved in Fe transport
MSKQVIPNDINKKKNKIYLHVLEPKNIIPAWGSFMNNRRSKKPEILHPQLNPLAHAIKQHRRLMQASLLAASSTVAVAPAMAQEAGDESLVLEEVTVTASKRAQSLQDVPMSITALDTRTIHQLGITNFTDYVQQMPNVSFKSFGQPGGATIYMRGVADGGDANASGSTPSVGLYLDEQPVTAIGSNLDIHIYDIERIEALAGPQGTLFGASSQSGTVRIITNKPSTAGYEAGFDLGGFGTKGGDASYSVEGYANIPFGDRVALRIVAWYVDEGGWIDNIEGSRTYTLEGGYGYNPNNFGRTRTINNRDYQELKNDFNEMEKVGLRAALKVDLSDNWSGTLGVITQATETEGVWEYDPTLDGKSSIQRFYPDWQDDEFTQASLTIEGNFDKAQLVYAGAYLDRDIDYQSDYSAYGVDAYFVPYYACDYSATGPDLATQSATDCTSLEEYYTEDNDMERTSHELRLVSMGDSRFQYTVGLYYEKAEHDYFLKWNQPFMSPTLEVPGYPGLYFRTDQVRKDTQKAAFGEFTWNFSESFSGTFGLRYFDEDHEVAGVVGWGPGVFCPDTPDCRDTNADSKVGTSDTVFKGNLTWRMSDDALLYVTYSEGYRPGGLNRDPGLPSQEWIPDILSNYEFGWKTTLANGRVRWNGAAYFMDWEDVQYTVYNFSLSACCGNVYNLSTAEVKGLETDISILASEAWTISAALAYNKGKTTDDFILPSGLLSVPEGTELPNTPEWKGNIIARYEFDIGDFPSYAQLSWNYNGSSWSEIVPASRFPQDSYSLANFRTGISKQTWGVDLFINNLTDEVAQIYVQPRNYEPTVVTNRPRSYGLRYWMRF